MKTIHIILVYAVAFLAGWLASERFSPARKTVLLHIIATPDQVRKP